MDNGNPNKDYLNRDYTVDPLSHGTYNLTGNMPKLTSGYSITTELERRLKNGTFLDDVLNAPDDVMELFREIFPEVVDSNKIGDLSQDSFKLWKPTNNDIVIEADPTPDADFGTGKDVYIGGPAALFAAAIQSNDPSSASNVLYGHNGTKGASNWKGSASYHHIRDILPVYYWPDNAGTYTIYVTIKHWFQKHFAFEAYKKEIYETSNFNKLRLNITGVLKDPSVALLFIKNGLNALRDTGLHMKLIKPIMVERTESTAYTTLHHASLANDIIYKMNAPKPILMNSSKEARNLLLLCGENEVFDAREVIERLQKVAENGSIDHRTLTAHELEERGYNTNVVNEGLEFPNDGYITPFSDQVMENMIENAGGNISDVMKLEKILVAPTEDGDCKATKIVWRHRTDNKLYSTPVKSLYLSLGPSMNNLRVIQPNYSMSKHFFDVIKAKLGSSETVDKTILYSPTFASLIQHAGNILQENKNLMEKIMHAAGASISILVKVDKSLVPESKMARFRDHIDSHNKHIVRLAEKEVMFDGKPYQFFVLQTTGGGHFPIKYAHPEAALNIIMANAIPVLGLNDKGIEYDIISARSCARGVTAQNVFRVSSPLVNMAMIYGIGGIGISTMASNGLLLKAILGARQKLSRREIDVQEFKRQLKESDFGTIPHWANVNPFQRNYAQFFDNLSNPMVVAKRLGVSKYKYPHHLLNILRRIRI